MSRNRPPRGTGREAGHPGTTWKGDVAFAVAVALVASLVVLRVFPELLQGQLLDTDSYMRLVRVRRLMETGGWFDGTIPRSNAPFGETLHWTRPVDVLIILGAWIAEPFLSSEQALHLSGVLLSPVLLIGICLTAAWAVRPVVGARMRYYTMVAVLAQVGIIGYALPGRADHNMLILLAFTAMLGSTLRLLLDPDDRRHAWAAGAWAGFGLWVSTEFLVALFVLLAALVVLWVWKGEVAAGARAVAMGLLLVVAGAVLLEHPPASLLNAEYDRISVVHLLLGALVAAFWTGAASLPERFGLGRRAGYAAIGGFVAVAAMLLVYPAFFGGPMVDVDPELKASWLPLLTEFQPYLVPHGVTGIGRILAYLGHAFLSLGLVAYGMRRDRGTPLVAVWMALGLALIVFIPLGIRWVRFVMYAEMVGVFGAIVLLSRVVEYLRGRAAGTHLAAVRALAAATLLAGPLLLGGIIMAAGGEAGAAVRKPAATQAGACPVDALVSILNDPDALGDRPHTVLAHIDLGPVLLYRTRHFVVGTPYHRNPRGILDWQTIMTTRNPAQARLIMATRGVDVVAACGVDPSRAPGDDPPFGLRLQTGDVPDWLTVRPVSDTVPGLRLYDVDPARPPS